MATRTSSSTKTPAPIATCCMRNLRQNSVQGVRTREEAAIAATGCSAPAGRASTGGVLMAGSLVANGGIDEAIEHVHHQVDQDELEREEQHQRLNDGVVAHVHCI